MAKETTATYLIAHTAPNSTNVAQAQVIAPNEATARKEFERLYPGRIITTTGVSE